MGRGGAGVPRAAEGFGGLPEPSAGEAVFSAGTGHEELPAPQELGRRAAGAGRSGISEEKSERCRLCSWSSYA